MRLKLLVSLTVGDTDDVMLAIAVSEAVIVRDTVAVDEVVGERDGVGAVPVSVKHSKLPAGHSDVPAA